jgi:DNA-binding IclR family transcriptional regulator
MPSISPCGTVLHGETLPAMSDIQSIKRAFDILKAISAQPAGASLSEIAARAVLPKSTTSRMLSTLAGVGMVEKLEHGEGYRLGDELVALAAGLPYPRSLIAIARPHLQALSQATGETLTLSVPEGDCVRYIEQINSLRALKVQDWTGGVYPMHAVSDGKLFLAFASEEDVERNLKQPLQRFTRNTLATPAALRKELRAIRKKGYAWTNGEYDEDIAGVAAPVFDSDHRIVAAVCLFGPMFRWPKEARAGKLIELTQHTANEISTRLR